MDAGADIRTDARFGSRWQTPLFSVIWPICGRGASTKSSIAALQAQSCPDFELVAVDAGDDPGNTGLLHAAAKADPRIRVLAAAGTSAAERLMEALRQSRGTYIAFWPGKGRLAADALEFAAIELRQTASVGGLCTAGFLNDVHGRSLKQVDIVTLVLSTYRPYLPAGFIVRDALVSCGLDRDDWHVEAIKLELWCRLAVDFGLRSVERNLVVDGKPHDDFLVPNDNPEGAVQARLAFLCRLFSKDGVFGDSDPALLLESKVHQLSILLEQARASRSGQAEHLRRHLLTVENELRVLLASDHRVLETLYRLACNRARRPGPLAGPLRVVLGLATRLPGRLPIHTGYTLWNFPVIGPWLSRRLIANAPPVPARDKRAAFQAPMLAQLYATMGELFSSRGQIGLALEMWEYAGPPRDPRIDGLACQILLKQPGVTEAQVHERHRMWFEPHVRGSEHRQLDIAAGHKGKIKIGYHCSFMNSATIRHQMRNVVAAHDRRRFEVYGYSPQALAPDNTIAFDVFRHTPPLVEHPGDGFHSSHVRRLSDDDFARLVREDGIDILVELSGFSPGNRFVAMSRRCAPIQVSYINHLGSSQVPNVDYLLSDDIATPPGWAPEGLYTESLYRLPGCFFCYDYRDFDGPPIVDPPSTRKGFVTFGCFGSGAKLNIELIELWASLLRRVPRAKLRLQNLQLSSRENQRFLANRFRRFDIDPDRLIIESGVDRPTLLGLYGEVDISLDTWPYCGGNTIAESLWQGVPVVSLKDDRFAGAYGASLLAAAGCSNLVAHSPEQYVDIAARLAGDSARLTLLRRHLRAMSVNHGLGDSESMARRLEAAYLDMVTRLCASEGGALGRACLEIDASDDRLAAAKAASALR